MATVRSEFTDEEWASLSAADRDVVRDLDRRGDPDGDATVEYEVDAPYDVVLDPDGHPI